MLAECVGPRLSGRRRLVYHSAMGGERAFPTSDGRRRSWNRMLQIVHVVVPTIT